MAQPCGRVAESSGGTGVHGLPAGDPIGAYTSVAFAVIGPWWMVVPEAQEGMRLVAKQWPERRSAS